MADKKISALTAATEAASEDLLHIIDDPSGSPVNKKLTVHNFMKGFAHTSTDTAAATEQVFLKITHNADSDNSSNDTYDAVATLSINTQPTHTSSATGDITKIYASRFTHFQNDANVSITTEGAAVVAELAQNASRAASAQTANTYPLILRVSNSATQTVNSAAFMKVDCSGAATQTVDFLMDLAPGGGFGAAAAANVGPMYTSGTASTVAGALKIRVSGETRYIQLYSAFSWFVIYIMEYYDRNSQGRTG